MVFQEKKQENHDVPGKFRVNSGFFLVFPEVFFYGFSYMK